MRSDPDHPEERVQRPLLASKTFNASNLATVRLPIEHRTEAGGGMRVQGGTKSVCLSYADRNGLFCSQEEETCRGTEFHGWLQAELEIEANLAGREV
jgi:hypothetical protein